MRARRVLRPVRSAFEANAENLKRVVHRSKSKLRAEVVLQPLYAGILELDNLPALCADHVVVVRTVGCFLVLRVPLRETVTRNESAFVQQTQSFIHRSARYLRAVILKIDKKIIGVEMIVPRKHGVQNIETLRSNPVLPLLQKFSEMLVRLKRLAPKPRRMESRHSLFSSRRRGGIHLLIKIES